jgi:hypothetical protein
VEIILPIGAIALLGYTIHVNIVPYPTSGAARWFRVVAGGILVPATVAVLCVPAPARRVGVRLTDAELT